MSIDNLIADLVKEEEANASDDDYDYINEALVRGRIKRGHNKTALKKVKGFTAASRKSPSNSPVTAAIPRSEVTNGMDKAGLEMKFGVSSKQEVSGGSYTIAPVKTDGSEQVGNVAMPKTSKFAKASTFAAAPGVDDGVGEDGTVADKKAYAKLGDGSFKESVKPWSAWDDEDPWA